MIIEINKYIKNIKLGKVSRYTTNENWTCTDCREQFSYRPFACAVICNKCLLKRCRNE